MKGQAAGSHKIRNVVITRSRKGNAELAGMLRAMGFEPFPVDTIEFRPPEDWSIIDACLKRLGEFDWVLFTSPTGVESFAQRMRETSLALPWRGKPAVAAVGEKTASALRSVGIAVDFVPSEYLTRALAQQLPRGRGRNLLILRADIAEPGVVATLERDGFLVSDVKIYRTSPVTSEADPATGSSLREADAIVFASPSAVEGFVGRIDAADDWPSLAKRLLAVCIGPVTANAARGKGFERILTAGTHTTEGILQSLSSAAAWEGE